MKKIEKGNLTYFVFESFEKTGVVNHCFSTRKGGVSTGCYESMNLSFRNDKKENVIKNFEIICSAIGADYKNVVFSDQVHDDKLYDVVEADRGKGLLRESDIKCKDGLITDKSGVVLTTFYADCVPLFFLEPNKRVIALTHSGWRGTVKCIGQKTVEKMAADYGCKKENILAGIAPSIGKCCFEVDYPVVKEFEENLSFSRKYIFKDELKAGKYKVDLQGINKEILLNSGLKEENIEIAGICTRCEHELLFSHRYMGAERGSLAALMELR